jgi:toxin ParE1/3/4
MAHRVSPQAVADLDDIWYYIAQESGSLETANQLIDSITDRFFRLSRHPHLGRCRDEDLGIGFRSFPVGEYVIVYRVEDHHVAILRVVHGRRAFEALIGIVI